MSLSPPIRGKPVADSPRLLQYGPHDPGEPKRALGSRLSDQGRDGRELVSDEPHLSLELIAAVAPARDGRIIDVGGGASVLVDRLLDLPFEKSPSSISPKPPWGRQGLDSASVPSGSGGSSPT